MNTQLRRRIDMSNLDAVKSYADTLGSGYVVFIHPNTPLVYDVKHISNLGAYHPDWVVYQTERKQAHG